MEYSFESMGSDPDQPVGELKINAKCVADNETLKKHIHSALDRRLTEYEAASTTTNAECAIVCAGPSLKSQVKRLKKLAKRGVFIIAVKAGHDFLIEHGITPHVAVAVDPREYITKYFSKKKKGIKYLIASQCHPAMFDFLSDMDVVLWHLMCTSCKEALEEYGASRVMVGGGSTSGGRAMVLAYMMGFRKINLFGMDSCVRSKTGKVIRSLEEFAKSDVVLKISGDQVKNDEGLSNKELTDKGRVVALEVGGKQYVADLPMAAQVDEFQKMLPVLDGVKVKSWGDGLISQIVKERRKLGSPDVRLTNEPWDQKNDIPLFLTQNFKPLA